MTKEQRDLLFLLLSAFSILLAIPLLTNFLPTGWDTFFHIKYTWTVVESRKIPDVNPYFPMFPLGYTPGAHALMGTMFILGGTEEITHIVYTFSILPAIFVTPIILAFYAFARKYLKPTEAVISSFLFYFSSLFHSLLVATNGAVIGNSLSHPYVSALVGFVLLPCFVTSLIRYHEERSTRNLVMTSAFLAGLILSYHIMAVVAFGLTIVYILMSYIFGGEKKLRRSLFSMMILSVLLSSPYVFHIYNAGLPKETGAISTYVVLSIDDYIRLLHPPLFFMFLLGLFLFLVSKQARNYILKISFYKLLILASWVVFLFLMAESWRLGVFLVNDRFAWYLIAPTSIIAVLGLSAMVGLLGRTSANINKKKMVALFYSLLILGTLFSLILLPELVSIHIPIRTTPLLKDEWRGVFWLNENAKKSVVISSPATSFLLASLTDINPVVIQKVMADYYIEGLEQRINDLKDIFQKDLLTALKIIDKYRVEYVYIGKQAIWWFNLYDIDTSRLLNAPYFKPVFPLHSFVKETSNAEDFDGDGVRETFAPLLWKGTNENTRLYFLTNPSPSAKLTMKILFHPRGTYGPVEVYVNNVLIANFTASESERGLWLTKEITVPREILKDINKIFIENLDPRNNLNIDYVSFDSIPSGHSDFSTVIYQVQYLSSLNVGSKISDLNGDGTLDVFDEVPYEGSYKEYYLYSTSGNDTKLYFRSFFPESEITGHVDVYINSKNITSLEPIEQTNEREWTTHEIDIPKEVLVKGWNTIQFVNINMTNTWFLDFIQLSS